MIPLWIASALLQARSFIGSAVAWFGRNPLVAALVALACTSGLLLHEYEVRGRTIARLTADKARIVAAQHDAQVAAQQAHDHQEAVYQAKAQTGQQDHDAKLAAAQSAVDDLRDQLRAKAIAGRAIATTAGASGSSPAIPESLPADSKLSLSEVDVRSCASATAYAIAAHDWATVLDVKP